MALQMCVPRQRLYMVPVPACHPSHDLQGPGSCCVFQCRSTKCMLLALLMVQVCGRFAAAVGMLCQVHQQ